MKKFLFLLLALSLSLDFAFASEMQIIQKTLFSTITDPTPGETVPFTLNLEDPMLASDKERKRFTIEGVSQPNVENNVFIMTTVPELIDNFNANISGNNITFSWNPRDVFDLTDEKIEATTKVDIKTYPADFLKIIERNETWLLAPESLPYCQKQDRSITKCRYVDTPSYTNNRCFECDPSPEKCEENVDFKLTESTLEGDVDCYTPSYKTAPTPSSPEDDCYPSVRCTELGAFISTVESLAKKTWEDSETIVNADYSDGDIKGVTQIAEDETREMIGKILTEAYLTDPKGEGPNFPLNSNNQAEADMSLADLNDSNADTAVIYAERALANAEVAPHVAEFPIPALEFYYDDVLMEFYGILEDHYSTTESEYDKAETKHDDQVSSCEGECTDGTFATRSKSGEKGDCYTWSKGTPEGCSPSCDCVETEEDPCSPCTVCSYSCVLDSDTCLSEATDHCNGDNEDDNEISKTKYNEMKDKKKRYDPCATAYNSATTDKETVEDYIAQAEANRDKANDQIQDFTDLVTEAKDKREEGYAASNEYRAHADSVVAGANPGEPEQLDADGQIQGNVGHDYPPIERVIEDKDMKYYQHLDGVLGGYPDPRQEVEDRKNDTQNKPTLDELSFITKREFEQTVSTDPMEWKLVSNCWKECPSCEWCRENEDDGVPSRYRVCDTHYSCSGWFEGAQDNVYQTIQETREGYVFPQELFGDVNLVHPNPKKETTRPADVRTGDITGGASPITYEYLLYASEQSHTMQSVIKTNPALIRYEYADIPLPEPWGTCFTEPQCGTEHQKICIDDQVQYCTEIREGCFQWEYRSCNGNGCAPSEYQLLGGVSTECLPPPICTNDCTLGEKMCEESIMKICVEKNNCNIWQEIECNDGCDNDVCKDLTEEKTFTIQETEIGRPAFSSGIALEIEIECPTDDDGTPSEIVSGSGSCMLTNSIDAFPARELDPPGAEVGTTGYRCSFSRPETCEIEPRPRSCDIRPVVQASIQCTGKFFPNHTLLNEQ